MTDHTVPSISAAARRETSSTTAEIAVLAALAATGTLATNILLPSLPQMAASLKVSSAAVTSAITVFLAVFALGQLVVGPIADRYGRRWRYRLRMGVRRNPPFDADTAQSRRDRRQLCRADRRSPLPDTGGNGQPDHGRVVRDVLGSAAGADRGIAFFADRARPVLRRDCDDRIRGGNARHQARTPLRARSYDPGRPARSGGRQPRDLAGRAVYPDLPAIPCGHEPVPARHGPCEPPGHGAGALTLRR